VGTRNTYQAKIARELTQIRPDANGNPLNISGLWALRFGNRHSGGDANTLYFPAGIANGGSVEDHGLLGPIQVAHWLPDFLLWGLGWLHRRPAFFIETPGVEWAGASY
jgi:hypothetical protein